MNETERRARDARRRDVFDISEAQVDDWLSVCGCNIIAMVVPGACRERFFGSVAWAAAQPTLTPRNGVVVFTGPGRRIEVVPARRGFVSLEAGGPVYFRMRSELIVAARTVEVVAGRVFVDVDDDGHTLGVEVLM